MTELQRMTSSRAFLLSIAGAAIGLGNIWRFPYIAGENGGSLFFIVYLFFVVVMGLPVMIAEISIGRAGRASPATSLRQLAVARGGSRHWSKLAGLGTLAAVMVLSFYSVVAGWILFYFMTSITTDFSSLQVSQVADLFDTFLASPGQLLVFHTLFITMTVVVSGNKVASGIERLNTWLMPFMYLTLLMLLIYVSGFPGFSQAVEYLLAFRGDAFSGALIIEAMGHAFFTLAIGACCLMAYGAYMPDRQSIIKTVSTVAFLDVLVAVMVGLASFTVVFSESIEPSSGPGLMFIALPVALGQLPMGGIVLPFFFLLLIFATWTSSVNLAEPLVVYLSRLLHSRWKGAFFSGVIVWLVGLIPLLSFNVFSHVTLFDKKSVFDVYTAVPTQLLLPMTGLLTMLFAGFVLGRNVLAEQLGLSERTFRICFVLMRYVSPFFLCCMLALGFLY